MPNNKMNYMMLTKNETLHSELCGIFVYLDLLIDIQHLMIDSHSLLIDRDMYILVTFFTW